MAKERRKQLQRSSQKRFFLSLHLFLNIFRNSQPRHPLAGKRGWGTKLCCWSGKKRRTCSLASDSEIQRNNNSYSTHHWPKSQNKVISTWKVWNSQILLEKIDSIVAEWSSSGYSWRTHCRRLVRQAVWEVHGDWKTDLLEIKIRTPTRDREKPPGFLTRLKAGSSNFFMKPGSRWVSSFWTHSTFFSQVSWRRYSKCLWSSVAAVQRNVIRTM